LDQGSGPIALRRRTGITLRAFRKEAGISAQQAAAAIRAHHSKISRMERGESPLKERDVADLLDLYGMAQGAEREELLADVRAAARQPWWHEFQDALPPWARGYLGMEADASMIRCYTPYAVPDLLQTESYAAAFTALARRPAETLKLRALRAARQEQLRRPGRSLRVVLDESAVLRPVGGPEVMHEQAAHLIAACKEPGITIQLLMLSAGARQDSALPFTMLRFADPGVPDVAYLETPTTGIYIDRPEDLDRYREIMTKLELAAEPPTVTPAILAGLW